MTRLTVITPPDEDPLSLNSTKAFLRIGHDGEDELVRELLQSARRRLEQVSGLALVTRTVRVTWTSWPARLAGRGAQLPVSPAKRLIAVRLVDPGGAGTEYTEHFQLLCGRLCLRPWSMAPVCPPGGWIEVDIEAGFGGATDVPEDLREALLRLTGAMYATRTPADYAFGTADGLPADVKAILAARGAVRL